MDEQATSTVGRGRPEATVSAWAKYITTLAVTSAVLFIAYIGTLYALDWNRALPPPSIVNEVCADEKLEWLRDNPPANQNLLVVGSSIAWRDIDSGQFVRRQPSTRPLNGGVCHLQVNQTEFVTQYFLQHIPSIRTVVAVLVPQDFTDCATTPSRLFDPRTADAYVFDRDWPYRFYVTQFDPVALIRNASGIRAMRDGRNKFDSMEMSRYGDGPLRIAGDRGLLYGKIARLDPTCFTALHDMAASVTGSGRRLFVATGPVNPAWSARYDQQGQLHDALAAGIQSALRGTGAEFWDGAEAFAGTPSDFTDAIHINWPAAQRYSASLAAVLDPGQDRP
jgi:hypothetical protein